MSLVSKYMGCPIEYHLTAAKRVLRYLKGTIDFGIFYKKEERSYLIGFSDSNYASDLEDKKNIFGYAFILSSGVVS